MPPHFSASPLKIFSLMLALTAATVAVTTLASADSDRLATQYPSSPRITDPSGSRTGEAYLRRYEVVTRLEVRGGNLHGRELQEQAALSLQRAAANSAHLTFVDTNLDDSRRAIRDYEESGDFNTALPQTPRRGNFIPATDRLELTVTIEHRVAPQDNRFRVKGTNARYSSTVETVKIGLSGRVVSIDTGAIAYALSPVWVERKATRNKRIETEKRPAIKGIEIPFLPPIARGGHKASSTSREISLVQQGLDEAATQLVGQLEAAPPMRLNRPALQEVRSPETRSLFVESVDMGNVTVYLSGALAKRLRRGDVLLLPILSPRDGKSPSRLVLRATVTAPGKVVEAHVQHGTLRGLDFDASRPIRVLESAAE